MGSAIKTVRYEYDAAGNRRLMVDPDGGRFTYAYDALNRISHLVNPQGDRTTYAYDADGRRTVQKLANGTLASFTYDNGNNLTRLANLKSDGTTISSFGYKYDKTGNRTSVVEADGSRVTWSYDATYQLTGEHRTGTTPYRNSNTFVYDPAGNRTLKHESGTRTTYAYDSANQLVYGLDSSGRTTYTFDADGNQQLVEEPNGDRTTTVWDYENRTTLVELPSGIRNTMAYEPDGLRVKLEESAGTKKFVWDGQNYLAEADENNDVEVVYTNEPRLYGKLVSQRRAGITRWYAFDVLGSTRQLTSASEKVTDTYLFDSAGGLIESTGSTVNPFRWVGRSGYYFTEAGIYYVRLRSYGPRVSRWYCVNPMGIVGGINVYLYALNNPMTAIDPAGLQIIIGGQDVEQYPRVPTPPRAPRTHPPESPIEYCEQLFERWLINELEMENRPNDAWLDALADCPCKLSLRTCYYSPEMADAGGAEVFDIPEGWSRDFGTIPGLAILTSWRYGIPSTDPSFHPTASACIRKDAPSGASQQCCYDSNGSLILGAGAGTPDRNTEGGFYPNHRQADVLPYLCARYLDDRNNTNEYTQEYLRHRPPNTGPNGSPCK